MTQQKLLISWRLTTLDGGRPVPVAELRRVAKPDDLIEVPVFYRLFSGRAERGGKSRPING
jgi:hypothetical protein